MKGLAGSDWSVTAVEMRGKVGGTCLADIERIGKAAAELPHSTRTPAATMPHPDRPRVQGKVRRLRPHTTGVHSRDSRSFALARLGRRGEAFFNPRSPERCLAGDGFGRLIAVEVEVKCDHALAAE